MYVKCKNVYQSQLDSERQGVLRNIGLTSLRLSIAAALTVSLNMIIKVKTHLFQKNIFEIEDIFVSSGS